MSGELSLPANAIAIVGMAGRFPGASSPAELWNLVRDGREAIRRLSESELRAAGVPASLIANPAYVRAAATLDGMDEFDAGFFGFSPRDAAIMDPQHRHFLECAWEAIESAGYTPEGFTGSIGVFGGCGMQAYFAQNLLNNPQLMSSAGYFLVRHTGNDKDFLTTRVSYQLNLKGPSVSVQTACSTSLVAVHLASQSLLNRECDMALAGGVTIEIPHGRGYLYEEGEILSPDGHCRSFDAASKGTVFGSGAGIVVLRRLEDAIEAGDHIHAVIIGSAVNNDGAGKVGYLAPSVDGQAAVVAEAIALAGISPESITYVEAHGTGTPVGDPIEIAGLAEAFGRQTTRRGYCGIGSIKTNIGHLDTAAGVASLIKAASAVEHAELPPSLHFEKANPTIPFAETPFYVNATLQPWKPDGPRRAGVTSLGVGGTNAHVLLEEAPARETSVPGKSPNVLVLSARSESALNSANARLATHLANNAGADIADVAHTLQTGRRTFDHRRVAICRDAADAVAVLRGAQPKLLVSGRQLAKTPSVVFLFPGGGAQYPNMGREIYDREPVFRQEVDRGLQIVLTRHGIDLRPLLFPAPPGIEAAGRELERSTNSILSVFIVEYALAQLWMSWGITPAAMTGHSLGEYAAACIAGVFSFEDALTIVKARGDIFERLPAGAMLSVPLSEQDLQPYLTDDLALAAANAPTLSVASGPVDRIEALESVLNSKDIETRRLHISVAAHSAMLEPYLAEFGEAVRRVKLSRPSIPFISNVTGQWADGAEVTRHDYWVRHLRQTVRFSDGLATLLQGAGQLLIEVGPGVTLGSLARMQMADDTTARVVASMRHPQDATSDLLILYGAVGQAWIAGVDVDWPAFQGPGRRRVPLPTYPFEHQRYWIDASTVSRAANATSSGRIANPEDWLSKPVWAPTEPAPPESSTPQSLLVFGGPIGESQRVVAALQARGHAVTTVTAGDRYERLDSSRYVVRADNADDYSQLLAVLATNGGIPARVAHLWLLDEHAGPAGHTPTDDATARGFGSLLSLAWALSNSSSATLARIDVVTSGMQGVADESVTHPEQALVLGPVRVIPRELGVACRAIDIDTVTDPLIDELLSSSADSTVALRSTGRFVESLEPFHLAAQDAADGLEYGGVYLITGGTGGIGRTLAEYLARSYGARVVMTSRTHPDDQDRFDGLLRALGGDGLFITADVTSSDAMRAAVAAATSRFGRLDGIFHTAGAIDDGLIAEKTVESARRVLAPKVDGTLAIERAVAGTDVKFVVLFSSTSAHLGLPGQVDYTAANAFLNAFARSRAGGDGPRFIAVGWGIWRDAGMAARLAGTDRTALPAADATAQGRPRLLGEPTRARAGHLRFLQSLSPRQVWVVNEHRLKTGEAILPGTAYVEIARATAERAFGKGRFEIRDLEILAPLMFEHDRPRSIRVDIAKSGRIRGFVVSSAPTGTDLDGSGWTEHARAVVLRASGKPRAGSLNEIRAACNTRVEQFARTRETRQERHLAFGPRWRNLVSVHYGDGEALARIELDPHLAEDIRDFPVHPALLDIATAAGLPLVRDYEQSDGLFVPIGYGRVRIHAPLTPRLYSHIRLVPGTTAMQASFDVTVMNERGHVLLEAHDFTMRRLSPSDMTARTSQPASESAPLAASWLANGIDAHEGTRMLDRVLASQPGPEILVSSISLDVLQQLSNTTRTASGGHDAGRALASADKPSGEVEVELAQIWRDLLGMTTVGANDDFFELGGHSLIAVRLVNRVEKRFGARIRLATLFEARTVRHLAALLGGSRESSAFSSLVAIQPSGSRPTLFVSHAVGGEVLSYSDLSRLLGPEQPFYAFRAVGHDGSQPFLTTIEQQAELYVREMRMHQPEGPYYLAGYSHGGRVVFEMALQLEKAGQDVAFVGIIDTWPHEDLPRGAAYVREWLRNIPHWLAADFAVTSRAEQWDRVKRSLQAIMRRFGIGGGSTTSDKRQLGDDMNLTGLPDHIRLTYEANFHAFLHYRPGFYNGEIVLFRAEAQPLNGPHGRDLGWGRVARSVKVINVPGNHGGLLQHPDVRDLARALREALAERRAAEQERVPDRTARSSV